MIGKALYDILSTTTAVTNLISTRVYPVIAPQSAAMPFAVYTIASDTPSDTKSGVSKLDILRVQIDIYATTYAAAIAVDEAIRTRLDKLQTTAAGLTIDGIKYINKSTFYEAEGESFRIGSEYEVRWKK